ncbi:MAG: hypothetical protein LUD17_01215 [Bacteroidales bacterium]|nr:hypothetical protein [Bacteroidales bacterium]
MKHLLLICSLLCALAVNAAQPQGAATKYSLWANEYYWSMPLSMSETPVTVILSEDGSIFIENLMSLEPNGRYFAGIIEDGKAIFASGQIVNDWDETLVPCDLEGVDFEETPETFAFDISDDGIFTLEDGIALGISTDYGISHFITDVKLVPMADIIEECPESADRALYGMSSINYQGTLFEDVVECAWDGDHFYISNLFPSTCTGVWTMGERQGNKLTFDCAQIAGTVWQWQFPRDVVVHPQGGVKAYSNGEMAINTGSSWLYWDTTDNLEFSIDDAGNISLESEVIAARSGLLTMDLNTQMSLQPIDLSSISKPATVTMDHIYINSSFIWRDVCFYLYPRDINGRFLDPDCMSYSIYLDDKKKEFTVDEYSSLAENTSDIPYRWDDQDKLTSLGNRRVVLFYDEIDSFEKVGVQVHYDLNGEAVLPTSYTSTRLKMSPYKKLVILAHLRQSLMIQ